jgi:hypothetical protein
MANYQEAYRAVNEIQSQLIQIYNDSTDHGVPVRKGDKNWNLAKMLFSSYGDKLTRKQHDYSTGKNVYSFISLIDERSISDGLKTVKQATDTYAMHYTTCKTGKCKGYDGYISLRKLN